jgi:hypothetical protein
MKKLSLLSLCLSLTVLVSFGQVDHYSFKEKYNVATPAQLEVSSADGNIDVVASSGNEIQVFYVAKRNGKTLDIRRKELEKDLIFEIAVENNKLKIKIEDRFKNRNWGLMDAFDHIYVNLVIYAPGETASNLHTSDGNVSLTGLRGDQYIKTSDGNIEISRIAGNVVGKTSDGNVRIKDIRGSVEIGTSDGNIKLDNIIGDSQSSTSDGNIELTNVKGNTSVRTSDGDIYINRISGSFKGTTSDGNIRGEIIDLKKELVVKTGDGNINIKIPVRLGLDLDIRGESLHVPLSNFSGKSDKTVIRGKCNGGGIPVNLSTSDGNITLSYL